MGSSPTPGSSGQSASDCDYRCGSHRCGAGRARGKLAEAFRAQARGNSGNGHGSLVIGRVRPPSRIPANWQFQRTRANGRERPRTDRTQEVAGSSPASSISNPLETAGFVSAPKRGRRFGKWFGKSSPLSLSRPARLSSACGAMGSGLVVPLAIREGSLLRRVLTVRRVRRRLVANLTKHRRARAVTWQARTSLLRRRLASEVGALDPLEHSGHPAHGGRWYAGRLMS
jgi:hypothetical protein